MDAQMPFLGQLPDHFIEISYQQSMDTATHHHANEFSIKLPKSIFKRLFIGTELEEASQQASSQKLIPKGLKTLGCSWHGQKDFPYKLHSQARSGTGRP